MKNTICMMTFLMLLSITFASGGGFGEYAGPLTFNTLNGRNTQTWTLVNTYNHSIQFTIIKPKIEGINVTTSPANGGAMPANSVFPIQVTVSGLTTATSNPTTAYITAQVVSNNESNINIAMSKQMIMYLEQTTITTSSITVSTSTSTVAAQAQQQSGNSNQSASGSTTIQSTQNKNSSIQSAGGGAAALSVSVIIPYLIVAIVLLLVVICALSYHITRNKPGTKKPRKRNR